jgi:serine/threonine-protein kinase
MNETPPPHKPVHDKPHGIVSRERLQALARRVGPSVEVLRTRPALAWALIVAVVLVSGTLVFLSIVSAVVHARREVVVPDLAGKTLDQALDVLSPLDLSIAKDAVEFDESFPPGAILRQAPPPGLIVREGKVVRVVLSSGGQVVFVPDIANKPLPEAQNLLRSSGLLLGAVAEAHSQRHENGWVMEQTPAPGTVLNKGQMVDLRVSKGPPPEGTILMPEFKNQPLTRAMEWLGARGLKAVVTEEVSADMLPGVVLGQTPPPDTLVSVSVPVEFVVSRSTLTVADTRFVRYEVPSGSDRVLVRIVVRDENGEKEVFQGYQDAGTSVEAPAVVRGPSRARIFVNGVLIEERVIE